MAACAVDSKHLIVVYFYSILNLQEEAISQLPLAPPLPVQQKKEPKPKAKPAVNKLSEEAEAFIQGRLF